MMVNLYVIGKGTVYVAHNSIVSIEPAPPNAAWYGIRAFVRLFDGRILEVSETPEQVLKEIQGDKDVDR